MYKGNIIRVSSVYRSSVRHSSTRASTAMCIKNNNTRINACSRVIIAARAIYDEFLGLTEKKNASVLFVGTIILALNDERVI